MFQPEYIWDLNKRTNLAYSNLKVGAPWNEQMLEKISGSRDYITLTESMHILIHSTKSSFVVDYWNLLEKCDNEAICYLKKRKANQINFEC